MKTEVLLYIPLRILDQEVLKNRLLQKGRMPRSKSGVPVHQKGGDLQVPVREPRLTTIEHGHCVLDRELTEASFQKMKLTRYLISLK